MAVEKKNRHQRIYRLQRNVMAGVTAVVIALGGGGFVWNGVQDRSSSAETQTAQARADFWHVVAGEKQPTEPSSATRLAIDLRDSLEAADNSDALPSELAEFRAEATDYPGVVDTLGFNPFDNAGLGCTVCGPLSDPMKADLTLVQDGQVDTLVDRELNAVEVPFRFPLVAIIGWSVLLFIAGSIMAVATAVRRDARHYGYAPITVDWRKLGGSDDKYKSLSRVLGLPYFVIVTPIKRALGKDYASVLQKTYLSDDERQLTELQNQVRSLPEGSEQREELQAVLYGHRDKIDQQVNDFVSRDRVFMPAKAQAVSDGIAERVREYDENQQFRRLAAEDLRADRKTNPAIGDPS